MTDRLGEAVVCLVHLVDSRLWAVGREAQREERLAGVGAVDGDCGNACRRGILWRDGETEAGGLNDVLGLDCVKVEARVVDLKIVQSGRTDLPDPARRVLVNISGAVVAEARNGCAGKRQSPGLAVMLVDANEGELVLLRGVEVKAAEVLVNLVGLYRVVGIAIRA